jgi:hypothetical protein
MTKTEATNRLSNITNAILAKRGIDRMSAWEIALRKHPNLAAAAGRAADDDAEIVIDDDDNPDSDESRHSRKCSSCGRLVSSDASYCSSCGTKIDEGDEDEDNNEETGAEAMNSFAPTATVTMSALDKMELQAQRLALNSGGKLSKAEAYAQLLKANPGLYEAYLDERPEMMTSSKEKRAYLAALSQRMDSMGLGSESTAGYMRLQSLPGSS